MHASPYEYRETLRKTMSLDLRTRLLRRVHLEVSHDTQKGTGVRGTCDLGLQRELNHCMSQSHHHSHNHSHTRKLATKALAAWSRSRAYS
jgi:hypothetical protein